MSEDPPPRAEADDRPAWKDVYRDEAVAARYARKREGTRTSRRRHLRELAIVERALDEAGLPPGARVLDLPTGTGRFVPPLRARGCSVVAADIALPMLARARDAVAAAEAESPATAAGPPPRFCVADVERLPFADGVFDLVVMVRLLHHAPDAAARGRMLAEVARVSRRLVLLSFFHAVSWHQLRDGFFHLVRPFERSRHALTVGRLREEAAACGLRLLRAYPERRFVKRNWFAMFEKA